MTTLRSQCVACKHYQPGADVDTCAAFPDGVPDDVMWNKLDHQVTIAGDHGVKWEGKNGFRHPLATAEVHGNRPDPSAGGRFTGSGGIDGGLERGYGNQAEFDRYKGLAHGTVISKSKRGTVEIKHEGRMLRYVGRMKNGENVGTYSSVKNAQSAVQTEGVINVGSGYVSPDIPWKDVDPDAQHAHVDLEDLALKLAVERLGQRPDPSAGGRFTGSDGGGSLSDARYAAKMSSDARTKVTVGKNVSEDDADHATFLASHVGAAMEVLRGAGIDGKVEVVIGAPGDGSITSNDVAFFDDDHPGKIFFNVERFDVNDRVIESGGKKGVISSTSAFATIHHEIGHMLNLEALDRDTKAFREMRVWSAVGGRESRSIAKKVSSYAAKNPHEFVAEVFCGVADGKKYGKDVMELYDRLGGPKLKGGRR